MHSNRFTHLSSISVFHLSCINLSYKQLMSTIEHFLARESGYYSLKISEFMHLSVGQKRDLVIQFTYLVSEFLHLSVSATCTRRTLPVNLRTNISVNFLSVYLTPFVVSRNPFV